MIGRKPTLRWQPPLPRQRRRRRRATLAALAAGLALCVADVLLQTGGPPLPRLLWNASASVPLGFYAVQPYTPIERGDILVVRLPEPIALLAARRHYLPLHVPLVKPVAAMPGDRVCARGAEISIDGQVVASRLVDDAIGRPLPWWQGCTLLRHGRLFLLSPVPDSFDSRYFGAVAPSAIVGSARPLWTMTRGSRP